MMLFAKYKPRKIYIEYKSSGIGLVQYLKTENIPLPIEPIPRNASGGDGDSVTRASGVSSYIKGGYVYVKDGAPWLNTFFHEIMSFPTGTHDDQVDTLVDLVAQEIIQNGNYLSPMNPDKLPLKDSTYEEVVAEEKDNLYDQIMADGVNYRNKPKAEDGQSSWMLMLS
jgi:predicted phage terminase large subunit-like protein